MFSYKETLRKLQIISLIKDGTKTKWTLPSYHSQLFECTFFHVLNLY